jgi:hypothetical protein
MARSGMENMRPFQAKRSCIHILGMTRTNSSQVFFVSSGLAPKPLSSGHVAERPVPNSKRPPEMMSRTAARSATRMGLWYWGTHATTPCPTLMRLVMVAADDRKMSGPEQCEYSSKKWCSTAQM